MSGGFIGSLISDPIGTLSNVISNPGQAISNFGRGANRVFEDTGTSIDQTVRHNIPGGWGTVAAVAGAVASGGLLDAPPVDGTSVDIPSPDLSVNTDLQPPPVDTPPVDTPPVDIPSPDLSVNTDLQPLPEPTIDPSVPPVDTPPVDTPPLAPAPGSEQYSLSGQTPPGPGIDPNLPSGSQLTMASLTGAAPALAEMGGGTGLTLPEATVLGDAAATGTLSAAGVTAANQLPALGDPNSFINTGTLPGSVSSSPLSKLPTIGTGSSGTAGSSNAPLSVLPDTSIPTLVAGLTKSTPLSINPYGVSFAGPVQTGDHLAKGGLVQHFEEGSAVKMPPSAGIWHGNSRVSLTPPHGALSFGPHFAEGGHFTDNEHVPEFYSEGGMHNRYVQGDGDGTSDDVPAMLANGEFVIPADVVSSLGNGSNDSGAKVLDHFLETIRLHKQAHDPKQLPPDSKGALAYLSESYKKARA